MGKEKKEKLEVIPVLSIKREGIYDFENLIKKINDSLRYLGYTQLEKEHSQEQEPGGEIKFDYTCRKSTTPYVKFIIDIEILVLRPLNVIVETNGKKKRMQKGELEIRIKAVMQKNDNMKFTASPYSEFIRRLYEKFIIKEELNKLEARLLNDANFIITRIKGSLDMLGGKGI